MFLLFHNTISSINLLLKFQEPQKNGFLPKFHFKGSKFKISFMKLIILDEWLFNDDLLSSSYTNYSFQYMIP